MNAVAVTRFAHSRVFASILCFVAFSVAVFCFYRGDFLEITANHGVALPSAGEWFEHGTGSLLLNLGLNAMIVVLLTLSNRIFNTLRSTTLLYAGLFALMQASTSDVLVQFNSGTLQCLLVYFCVMLLFGCYRFAEAPRRIFAIFFLLSGAAATQYSHALYILVFIIGTVQMRIFNGRVVVAMLLGMITPWWLLFGFGAISFSDLHIPELHGIFSNIEIQDTLLLLVAVGVTGFAAILCFVMSSMKIIAYNARYRAFNGVYAILTLITIIGMCIDYNNLAAYIPLLNLCAAYQCTHFFTTRKNVRSGYAVLAVVAIYIGIVICRIAI